MFVRVQRPKVCCDYRGYRTKVSRLELTMCCEMFNRRLLQ